jgi:hypothetical protein
LPCKYATLQNKVKSPANALISVAIPICSAIVTLLLSLSLTAKSPVNIWGTTSGTLVSGTTGPFAVTGVLTNTFTANAPQLALSFIYFFVNNVLTLKASNDEWNRYGSHRQPLRVTKPEGQQKTTHFLQLACRYGVPLPAFAGTMHWLLSQSLYIQFLEILSG